MRLNVSIVEILNRPNELRRERERESICPLSTEARSPRKPSHSAVYLLCWTLVETHRYHIFYSTITDDMKERDRDRVGEGDRETERTSPFHMLFPLKEQNDE